MALVVKQSVISPISMAYAQNLLIGDSLKCGQVWSRFHWVNTILFKIKDTVRDWSFNWKCDAVIRSLEQKHFGHTEKALTELIDFVTTKVGDPNEIRRMDLRAPLLEITYKKLSEEIAKRCPTSLQEFQKRFYERILLKPQLLSLKAARRSEVIGEIEVVSTRNQAMFEGHIDGNIFQKTLAALGSQYKPEELSRPAELENLDAFREEIKERIFSKVQMLVQNAGKEPITRDMLYQVLGSDIDCLNHEYISFFVDTLRLIQEYPEKKKQELKCMRAFEKAEIENKNLAADMDLLNQLYAVEISCEKFAELMDYLVVDPLTEIIVNGQEIEEKYLKFIDDPQSLQEELQMLVSKSAIQKAIRRRLSDPKLEKLTRGMLMDAGSHVCACIEKKFTSKMALMEALFANKIVANMIDQPIAFVDEIFALREAENEDIPQLVEACVENYAKTSFSIFQFFALEIDVKSLEDEIKLLKEKKQQFNDSRLDDEWQLLNFELQDACKDLPVPKNMRGARKLRWDLIQKNGLLTNELGQLQMALTTGAMERAEAAPKIQAIQAELDDLSSLGEVLKKWIDEQERFEKVRDKYFTDLDSIIGSKEAALRLMKEKCQIMFDQWYDWAVILGVDPQKIGSFLGKKWSNEAVEEYRMTQRVYQQSQIQLSIARQNLSETAVNLNAKLMPGQGFTLGNYLQDPQENLRFIILPFLNTSFSAVQKKQAARRNKQAKKITPIVMQSVVDKTAEGVAVDKSWRNVTSTELFKLVIKISGRNALDKNEKALLTQMIGHIHEPIFDLQDEEIVLIEENHATSDSQKWDGRTLDACVKFLIHYQEKILSLNQT